MRMLRFVLPCFFAASLHAADPLPGHSTHGEAFNEGPRQAAVLMEGCGAVSFPVTTANAEAQKFFTQGVGQLHGFWYYEAERSFRQAATLDPDCAMTFWGCAMANVNNEKRAKEFIAKATALKAKTSKREQAWITSLQNFYADSKKDKKQKHLDFIKDQEAIIHDFPDDLEAKAFLAWAIWKAKDADVPMVSRESVNALLQQVFAKEPMHPAHHYVIHLWDDQKPARALSSAAKCGQSAPAIAHMWHMPGHTFSKLNRFDDAVWQQDAAIRVDHRYLFRTQILPDQIHNYAHNAEWLVRSFAQVGRAREAISLAKNLIEMPRHPKSNTLDKGKGTAAYGRTRLLETLLKFELWDDVLELENSPYLDASPNPSFTASWLRAKGVAAFFKKDQTNLQTSLTALETLKKKSPAPEKTKEKEKKNKPENDSNQQAQAELRALLSILNKRPAPETQSLLDKAKDIPKERLVRYQLALANVEKATLLIKELPGDAPGLSLRVIALQELGKAAEAKAEFVKLRVIGNALDVDLPFAKELDASATTFGFPQTWRVPAPATKDTGTRPPLETLGEPLWQPSVATDFELKDRADQIKSLQSFQAKPTIFIFYLGHDCGHCMEQLKTFTKAAKDFEKAGIHLVAIGSENVADLAETSKVCDPAKGAPFVLLADPERKTFKAWRCYDDFEGLGLHGVFLVDTAGKIRWLDVRADPFMDAKFLLTEAQRLLRF